MISSAFNTTNTVLPCQFTLASLDKINANQHLITAYSHYKQSLSNTSYALSYLHKERGLSLALIDKFGFGYSDRTLCKSMVNNPHKVQVRGSLKCVGLIKPNGHELFLGAIILPITYGENILGGYGRRISTMIRQKSSVYPYHLVEDDILFNEECLVQSPSCVLLAKNPIDAISLIQMGYEHVISFVGPVRLTDGHVRKLKHHRVKLIKTVFNLSDYYLHLTREITAKLGEAHLHCKCVEMPSEQDVNSLLCEKVDASKRLNQLIRQAQVLGG